MNSCFDGQNGRAASQPKTVESDGKLSSISAGAGHGFSSTVHTPRRPLMCLIRRAARAPLGALLLVIAVLWLGAAIHGLVAGDPAIVPGLGAGGAYLVGALGVALALLALNWMVRGLAAAPGTPWGARGAARAWFARQHDDAVVAAHEASMYGHCERYGQSI